MPELPEVETVKNELIPYVVGHRITGVTLDWGGIVRQPSASEFYSRLIGQKITGIRRRGKYLIFDLSSGSLLITGSLLISQDSSPPKYTRAIINLDKDTRIFFRDPRKFGRMWLVENLEPLVGKLGPEPLEPGFTPKILAQRLAKRKAPIKAILLDQNFIAGIGNMYADEALFRAKIHPERAGSSLSPEEIERLYQAIQQVLWAAIENKGASVENYFRPDGTLGKAHFEFQVAHRLGGDTCPICGTPIERKPIRNRGSYFCPKCQPKV
jgi:formamidopyrimidine-DNA glycosylase